MLLNSVSRLGAYCCVNVRPFNRMSSFIARRPVKVVNWDKIKSNYEDTQSSKQKVKSKIPTPSVEDTGLLQTQKLGLNEEVSENAESQEKRCLPPMVEQKDDMKFSKYMIVVKSRSQSRKAKIILLEGKKLINDALASGVTLEALFVSRRKDIAGLALPSKGFYLGYMPYKYFQKWSDTVTPPGVLGIFKQPSLQNILPDPKSIPLTVVCDNIRDPGNMGAILRILAGVGCQKIFVTKGCVDIWNPKVLRAACGGHFRVPIEYDKKWEEISAAVDNNASVFLADCDQIIEKNDVHPNFEAHETSSSDEEDISTSIDVIHTESPSDDACIANSNMSLENIKSLPYYDMKFKVDGSNILVVSNESYGVSKKALEFALNRGGVKVHIPLCGKVESLNVVSALSVISFEMRRQAALFNVT